MGNTVEGELDQVEGELDQVLDVVRRCFLAPEPDCHRITCSIRIDSWASR
jgi:uncharacterized protein YqgV (UPF0045/DUF77 family)